MSSVSSGWLMGSLMGSWWGFAEADRAVLGLMVVVLAALAIVYTVMRLLRTRGADRRRAAGGVADARRDLS